MNTVCLAATAHCLLLPPPPCKCWKTGGCCARRESVPCRMANRDGAINGLPPVVCDAATTRVSAFLSQHSLRFARRKTAAPTQPHSVAARFAGDGSLACSGVVSPCPGAMDDAAEQKRCADLKIIYSKCFNSWYTEKFLKGDSTAACQVEFEAYRVSCPAIACVIDVWAAVCRVSCC